MAYQIGERATLVIDDGPYTGVEARVDTITSAPMYVLAMVKVTAYLDAEEGSKTRTLHDLYAWFLEEARPAWNIETPRGPLPPTVDALLRIPIPLGRQLIDLWTSTFEEAD